MNPDNMITLHIRVPAELRSFVSDVAEDIGSTPSQVARKVLSDWYKSQLKQQRRSEAA